MVLETNKIEPNVLFYYSMLIYSSNTPALNTLIFQSKVLVRQEPQGLKVSQKERPVGNPVHENRTGQPGPKFNYELLTATTLIYAIGAGITAAAGTRLASNCSSLRYLHCTHSNYKTRMGPVSLFIVTTS
ncbi:hypothetical protein GRS66_003487 [Saccharomyces pastorianus]|uniref:Uncharacterized protein n=1 Tax=Saccharomyces pastorianus TaxID=27292 RepID=A0A6C1DVP0_SACPS|nr:hypothetical protein GRS66_003487 [Saccharomyces pastorianus]